MIDFESLEKQLGLKKIQERIEVVNEISQQAPLSFVSGYFDISRPDRTCQDYYNWMQRTFRVNAPILFFTQSRHVDAIREIARNIREPKPFIIFKIEMEELSCYRDLEAVRGIIASTEYRSRMAEAENRLECNNPFYSITIFSKTFLLDIAAALNPFSSEKFVWIDAGLSRHFGEFDLQRPLLGSNLPRDHKFLIMIEERAFSDPYFTDYSHFAWSNKNYVKAGMMGGTGQAIRAIRRELEAEWNSLIHQTRVVTNEQIGLVLLYFRMPHLFYLWRHVTNENLNMDEFLRYLSD